MSEWLYMLCHRTVAGLFDVFVNPAKVNEKCPH